MGLKVLHSADWHMDSPFAGFTPEQRAYLRAQQRRIPDMVADLCRRENCDLVLLGGDIFDGSYSRESADIVRAALERCRVPVLISPGNHDPLGPGSPWMEETWPENVHIFREGLRSVVLPELECRVYGAGYRSMDCPPLLETFKATHSQKYLLGLLHGDPMVLKSPYCPVTASQVRNSGLHYLALGHIHKAGSFRAGKTLCAWPGTPMGRGFDEKREKGVYIVEIGEETTSRFVQLDTPRFYDLEADVERNDVESLFPAVGNLNFYRLTLTGSGGETAERIRENLSGFPNLEIIDRREAPSDPWEKLDADTLEGTYLRLLQENMRNAESETREVVLLAAEISKKLLEGKEVIL